VIWPKRGISRPATRVCSRTDPVRIAQCLVIDGAFSIFSQLLVLEFLYLSPIFQASTSRTGVPVFITSRYPLHLFVSVQARVRAQAATGRQRLAVLLEGAPVTADTMKMVVPATAVKRDEALALLTRLESANLLDMLLSSAIRGAELGVDIPGLRDRIAFYEQAIALWSSLLDAQPLRDPVEAKLRAVQAELDSLRSAGSSEAATHQRSALRGIQEVLPVLGREDLAGRRVNADRLATNLALEQADLQRLMSQTPIELVVDDHLGPLLEELGLEGNYQQPPAEQGNESDAGGQSSDAENASGTEK